MEQILKKVLKKIENNGYEAYLVGGYVRDMVLGKKTYDIDICTNALPKELNNAIEISNEVYYDIISNLGYKRTLKL